MDPFWGQVKYVLKALVMKAVGQDKDGMDLRFTSGAVGFQGGKTWKDFKGPMNDKKILPIRGCLTNMTAILGNVMDSYIKHCQKYRQNAKNLSLLVLTDAKWTGERHESDIGDKIIKCIESLERTIGDLKHRPVGIQFIQFGRDVQATERLRRLDNDLVFKKEGIPSVTPYCPAGNRFCRTDGKRTETSLTRSIRPEMSTKCFWVALWIGSISSATTSSRPEVLRQSPP